MKHLSLLSKAAAAALVCAAGVVHAGNVFWSVGIAQPGVQVGVSNAPPRPVVQPQVIVQPVYAPAPVVYYPAAYPAPVVAQPAYQVVRTAWVQPGHWHRGHHGHREEWDRGERRGWDRR